MEISQIIKKLDFEALLQTAHYMGLDTSSYVATSFREVDTINEHFFTLIRELCRTQFSGVEVRSTRNQQGISVSVKTEGLEELLAFAAEHRFNSFHLNGIEESDEIRFIRECINTIIVPTFSNFNNGSTFVKRNGRMVFYFEYVNGHNSHSLYSVAKGFFEVVEYVEKIQSYNMERLNQILENFESMQEEARRIEAERAAEREAQQRAIRDARIAREAEIAERNRQRRLEAERLEAERRAEQERLEEERRAAEAERRAVEEAERERLRRAGANEQGIEIARQLGLL